jgi:hypothetical protein
LLTSAAGVPVLHDSQLELWQQQQQQQQQGRLSSWPSGPVYVISCWESHWSQPLHGLWSEYYKSHNRQPYNVELAPWVAKRYKRSRAARQPSS